MKHRQLSQCDEYKVRRAGDTGLGEFKVLLIGNSITRHGVSEKTVSELKWSHVSGMAASSEEADYAHLLAKKLGSAMPGRNVKLFYHNGGGGGAIRQRLSAVGEVSGLRPDLVVIQLGEHEAEGGDGDALYSDYKMLIKAFDAQRPRPLVICTGLWDPDQAPRYGGWRLMVENIMKQASREVGVPFVSVEDLAVDPACHGAGSHDGVRWHPNDKGHRGYAERIFAAWDGAETDSDK